VKAFFDWFFYPGQDIKPPKIRPPQLGYTVSQGEYDKVSNQLKAAHEQLDTERRTHREREASLLSQLTDARTALEVVKARANKKKIPTKEATK